MRTMTHLNEEQERLNFAAKAAEHFASNPEHTTYTEADVTLGAWFAVRWGMGEDCVLTFRISDEDPIIIYQQAIEKRP